MKDVLDRRFILVTGKGGVGRSTLTAALAIAAARAGKRALVTEVEDLTGGYSPLARVFGRDRFDHHRTALPEGVEGVVLRSELGHELFLASVLRVKALAHAAMSSKALRRLLYAAPSFYEMGIFYHLLTLLQARDRHGHPEHELIVFDAPATGHTLGLTGLPQILLGLVPSGPIATALREGQSIINDPRTGAAYVVTLPETLPVTEALELIEGLERTRMPVGGVIANRVPVDPFTPEERHVLPDLLDGGRLFGARSVERLDGASRSIARLREAVGATPVRLVPECVEQGIALPLAIARGLLEEVA